MTNFTFNSGIVVLQRCRCSDASEGNPAGAFLGPGSGFRNQDICALRVEEHFTGISKMVVYMLLKPTNSVFLFLTAIMYLHHAFTL